MIALIVFGLPMVVPTILLARHVSWLPDGLADWAVSSWSSALCRVYGFRLEVVGPMPKHPVLLIANHISWADIEVLHARVACGFVAKAEIRHWPLIGWLASVGGTIFHQRGSTKSLERVCADMTRRLRDGRSVAIFPEGRTGDGKRLGAFHARLFQAAIDARVPVQPVALLFEDAQGINQEVAFGPEESFLACFIRLLGRPSRRVRLIFDAPIDSQQPRRDLAQECRKHIAAMLGESE
jgi:1-acyl-sn-glycerol-3-phosphate acyltransferase